MSVYPEDDIARRYVACAELLTGIRALDVVAMRGEYCALCNHGRKVKLSTKHRYKLTNQARQKYRYECSDCRQKWQGVEVPVFVGEVDIGRNVGATEERVVRLMAEFHRLRPMIENRPRATDQARWDFAVIAWLAFLDRRVGTLSRVVEYGERHRPRFSWSVGRVRGGIDLARATVRARLGRRGRTISWAQ